MSLRFPRSQPTQSRKWIYLPYASIYNKGISTWKYLKEIFNWLLALLCNIWCGRIEKTVANLFYFGFGWNVKIKWFCYLNQSQPNWRLDFNEHKRPQFSLLKTSSFTVWVQVSNYFGECFKSKCGSIQMWTMRA